MYYLLCFSPPIVIFSSLCLCLWFPSALSTCFILTVVALLAGTRHCLGLIRHWSKREETDLNYPFHSLTASPLTHLNSSSEPFICMHTHRHTRTHKSPSFCCSVIVLYDQAWMSTNSMFSLFSSWQWNNTCELWLMPISVFPLCLPAILFLSLYPSFPSYLFHSLCSTARYHSVSVTVTMRAFGAPCRHSHVAVADMRMWPWLAAPWRATREHFKGCLTAGWEILCSPWGPRTSAFRYKLIVQKQHAHTLEQERKI